MEEQKQPEGGGRKQGKGNPNKSQNAKTWAGEDPEDQMEPELRLRSDRLLGVTEL